MTLRSCLSAMIGVLIVSAAPAFAQSNSNVFGSVVKPGERSTQYRIALDPDSGALTHRLHYQAPLTDNLRWRVVGQLRDRENNDVDFDYVQGELLWQLAPATSDWKRALRLDVRVRDEDRPGFVSVNFANQVELSDQWRARAIILSAVDFGSNTRDGIFVQTRGNLTYKTSSQTRLGVEMFNRYGSTDGFNDFDDQRHQIGPVMTWSSGSGWSVLTSVLFGVTDATDDTNLRMWITKKL